MPLAPIGPGGLEGSEPGSGCHLFEPASQFTTTIREGADWASNRHVYQCRPLRAGMVSLPSQHAIQPRLGPFPIALDPHWRDSQNLCRFLDAQSAEVAQLYHAGLAGIDLGQRLERLVQGQYFDSPRLRPQQHVIQRHAFRLAAALGIPPPARMVNQNSPNDLRAEGQKVHAVFAADAPGTN